MTEHAVLSSFDVRIPDDILPDTPDDRRLTGAIASDGTNENGFAKFCMIQKVFMLRVFQRKLQIYCV